MKTKIIPFDLEMAEKIQAGEIEGKMVEVTTKKFTYNSHGCIAIDQKVDKFIELPEEAPKHDDIEEVPTVDGSIVFLRHKKHEFKPFDKVLVRSCDELFWSCDLFSHVNNDIYICIGGGWSQCISYEGNEHLVGTTNKPKEE